MSRPWTGTNTSAWRRMRLLILNRDNYRCRMPLLDGKPCLAPANTVDHITPLHHGGAFLDPINLRAACARHNYAAGARITNSLRGATPRILRMTPEAQRLVHILDRLEVPADAGRTAATRWLQAAGIRARSDALDAACAVRRRSGAEQVTTDAAPGRNWTW